MEARRLESAPRLPNFQILLRIRHPSMDPALISRELRLEPEHSFMAGEKRKPLSAVSSSPAYGESFWLGTLYPVEWPLRPAEWQPDEWRKPRMAADEGPVWGAWAQRAHDVMARDLGAALGMCAVHLGRHASFLRRIQADEGEVNLRIELYSGAISSFALAPQNARTLGELGLALEFEFVER